MRSRAEANKLDAQRRLLDGADHGRRPRRCFRTFSEEGGYFLDDLAWQQFSLREAAGVPPVVTIIDGPKALDSPIRSYLGPGGHVLPEPYSTSCSLNSECPATRKHHSCVDAGVGTSRVGLIDRAAQKATTKLYDDTTCYSAKAAAPEAEGWCAAFADSGVKARHCVPWSSKTHVYDAASRGWALGFLWHRARNPAARQVIMDLRREMMGKAISARPSFSQALDRLAVRSRGIKEELL